MRLALISDQHGNDVAFRAALEDVERLGVEEIVCLGASLLLFHGSPRSYDDVLLPELAGEALEPFLGHDAALLAGGHTHLQWTRRIGDALYVNPGSVGISYDRHEDPPNLRALAEWALVTVVDGTVAVEFRQVRMRSRRQELRRSRAAARRQTSGPHSGHESLH